MDRRRRELKLSKRRIARDLSARYATVRDVFRGIASSKKVYPVAQRLGMSWAKVHDLTLLESDYFLALQPGLYEGAHLIAPQTEVSNSR